MLVLIANIVFVLVIIGVLRLIPCMVKNIFVFKDTVYNLRETMNLNKIKYEMEFDQIKMALKELREKYEIINKPMK